MKDHGIGISDEDRQHLFKAYFKTKDEKSKQMNKTSHGLGLNICKKIALNLGGDLVLRDSEAIGCLFELSLTLTVVKSDKEASQTRPKQVNTKFGTRFNKRMTNKLQLE